MAADKSGYHIGGEAVEKKTGKPWSEWLKILDKYDVVKNGHRNAAFYLHEKHGISAWWSQTVVVKYEYERGLRTKEIPKPGKLEFSVSRTIAAAPGEIFDAWADPAKLNLWFTTKMKHDFRQGGEYKNGDGDKGVYLYIADAKRIRFTWENEKHCPGTEVNVWFFKAPSGKTSVRISHSKLASEKDVADMREGWSWALDSLKSFIETGKPIKHEDWLKARNG